MPTMCFSNGICLRTVNASSYIGFSSNPEFFGLDLMSMSMPMKDDFIVIPENSLHWHIQAMRRKFIPKPTLDNKYIAFDLEDKYRHADGIKGILKRYLDGSFIDDMESKRLEAFLLSNKLPFHPDRLLSTLTHSLSASYHAQEAMHNLDSISWQLLQYAVLDGKDAVIVSPDAHELLAELKRCNVRVVKLKDGNFKIKCSPLVSAVYHHLTKGIHRLSDEQLAARLSELYLRTQGKDLAMRDAQVMDSIATASMRMLDDTGLMTSMSDSTMKIVPLEYREDWIDPTHVLLEDGTLCVKLKSIYKDKE